MELSNPSCTAGKATAVLGEQRVATVTIVDDDEPGTLFFEKEADTIAPDPFWGFYWPGGQALTR